MSREPKCRAADTDTIDNGPSLSSARLDKGMRCWLFATGGGICDGLCFSERRSPGLDPDANVDSGSFFGQRQRLCVLDCLRRGAGNFTRYAACIVRSQVGSLANLLANMLHRCCEFVSRVDASWGGRHVLDGESPLERFRVLVLLRVRVWMHKKQVPSAAMRDVGTLHRVLISPN